MPEQNITASSSSNQKRVSRLFGRFLVNYRFQFKISSILLAILAFSAFVLWLESHLAVERLIQTQTVTNEESILQLQLLGRVIGNTAILTTAVAFGLILFLTHFIAGPLYRFVKTFQELREGNLAIQIRLRKHDELKDVADAFNQGMSHLRYKVRQERERLEIMLNKMDKFSAKLKEAGSANEATQLDNIVNEFKNHPPMIKL